MNSLELPLYLPDRFQTWLEFYLYLKKETHDFMYADPRDGQIKKMEDITWECFEFIHDQRDKDGEGVRLYQPFTLEFLKQKVFEELLRERMEFTYEEWYIVYESTIRQGCSTLDTINKLKNKLNESYKIKFQL